MTSSTAPCDSTLAEYRTSLRSIVCSSFLVRQSFDARQFLPFQKFQRCSTAGGNVRNLIGHIRGLHGRHGVSAADDRNRPTVVRYGMRNFEGALRKSRNLEHTHGAVPNDSASGGDFVREQLNRLRANIERHLV